MTSNFSAKAKRSVRESETFRMGDAVSSQKEPALKALRYMLKSVWEAVITLALWIRTANLFSWNTWSRVEELTLERERHFDTALKASFHPDAIPPPSEGERERGSAGLGGA